MRQPKTFNDCYRELTAAFGCDMLSASEFVAAQRRWQSQRVKQGLEKARAQGKRLGRPLSEIPLGRIQAVSTLTVLAAAQTLGVSRSTMQRWRRALRKSGQP